MPACQDVDCSEAQTVGVLEFQAELTVQGCVCVALRCEPGYQLLGASCIYEEACPPGYVNEGGQCIDDHGVSCADAPQMPNCIPPLCSEQSTGPNGEDLRALGKCIEGQPPPPQGCTQNCHSQIENPHPWLSGAMDLSCTGCHGGDPEALTREEAHVPLPPRWGSINFGRPELRYYYNYLTLNGVERFEGGLEWLRFRDPGDLRVADQSCGKNSGCHQDRVENMRRSLMANAAGLIGSSMARNGISRAVVSDDLGLYKWDSTRGLQLSGESSQASAYEPHMVGSVQRLEPFSTTNRALVGGYGDLEILQDIYDKECLDCHLGSAGRNDRLGSFRGSGCTACHMVYSEDGRSWSQDQMIAKNEPTYPAAYTKISQWDVNDLQNLNGQWRGPERPHPIAHQLVRTILSKHCGTCHSGSNNTDWQYRGFQIDPNQTAQAALQSGVLDPSRVQFTHELRDDSDPLARYRGLARTQILRFVDWDNDGLDDIPADIHYQAGLECVDCHTSAEMHNELKYVQVAQVSDWGDPNQVVDMSGAIWSHMDQATEVECVHCHGNLEYRAVPYEADNRNPLRNLIACTELGETIPGYSGPLECQQLGRGRWMQAKFTGRWHYVPQTLDTVSDLSGAAWPNGQSVYTANASVFHGRVNLSLQDGVGPCESGDPSNCYLDQELQEGQISENFSHLGRPATSPVDQHEGGMECYACHATWANSCFGCHLRLSDLGAGGRLYDFSRSTGELTLGFVSEADFSYISPLDMQYGLNGEGKISQMLPESKQMVAHTDQNGNEYFGTNTLVNLDPDIEYNVYRHRSGYGLRQFNTEAVGLPPNSDGGVFEQFAEMDLNAGQGTQPMMPHTVQRSHPRMNCQQCHLSVEQDNEDEVLARWMARPAGFSGLSAYLDTLQNVGIVRADSGAPLHVLNAAGFRFGRASDPQGFSVEQQADWCVDALTGFPLCYTNHPMRVTTDGLEFDPRHERAYPTIALTSGPLNVELMRLMFEEVRVWNSEVSFRGRR